MPEHRPEERALDPRDRPRPLEESFVRGGLLGISAVALATLALALAGALIALVVSLLF